MQPPVSNPKIVSAGIVPLIVETIPDKTIPSDDFTTTQKSAHSLPERSIIRDDSTAIETSAPQTNPLPDNIPESQKQSPDINPKPKRTLPSTNATNTTKTKRVLPTQGIAAIPAKKLKMINGTPNEPAKRVIISDRERISMYQRLSIQQKEVFNYVINEQINQNVFFTGSAGKLIRWTVVNLLTIAFNNRHRQIPVVKR